MTPDEKHFKRINKYLLSINGIYDELIREIVLLVIQLRVADKIFRFKDYPRITKQVNEALKTYRTNLNNSVKIYSEYEWDFANKKIDGIITDKLNSVKSQIPLDTYENKLREIAKQSQNKSAFEAFQTRKKGKFTTSERVWNIAGQAKENLELAIDVALKEGVSAQELARQIKGNLNNPDALFRRVRDKHGNLVLSKNAKTFNPGQGVYRSAHKNALRMAANEINTAYREAEQIRISKNPDIVGVKISLLPQHFIYDLCDELQGIYPKDFIWSKWHLRCNCFRTTILKSDEEFISELNQGLELPPESSKNFVKVPPKEFDKWIDDNSAKMENWKRKPSFITDNQKFVNGSLDRRINSLMDKAKNSSDEVSQMLTKMNAIHGGYSTPVNLKGYDSMMRKITTELGGNVSSVKDAVRATVILPIKDYQMLADKLEKSGIFERVKYQSPDKFSGYSGIITNFKTKNGIYAEVQFNTDKLIFAKEKPSDAIRIMGERRWLEIKKETRLDGGKGHDYYEKMRVLNKKIPSELSLWEKLNKESNDYYINFR